MACLRHNVINNPGCADCFHHARLSNVLTSALHDAGIYMRMEDKERLTHRLEKLGVRLTGVGAVHADPG